MNRQTTLRTGGVRFFTQIKNQVITMIITAPKPKQITVESMTGALDQAVQPIVSALEKQYPEHTISLVKKGSRVLVEFGGGYIIEIPKSLIVLCATEKDFKFKARPKKQRGAR